MTRPTITARRVQDAILDELQRQGDGDQPRSLDVATIDGGQACKVEGIVDVRAIAIVIANLVADQ